jgi:hypothetical protein
MTRGVKAAVELSPEEIAQRDLTWLEFTLGRELSKMRLESEHGEVDEALTLFLRGIARTANAVARHYENQLGLPPRIGRNAAMTAMLQK